VKPSGSTGSASFERTGWVRGRFKILSNTSEVREPRWRHFPTWHVAEA